MYNLVILPSRSVDKALKLQVDLRSIGYNHVLIGSKDHYKAIANLLEYYYGIKPQVNIVTKTVMIRHNDIFSHQLEIANKNVLVVGHKNINKLHNDAIDEIMSGLKASDK